MSRQIIGYLDLFISYLVLLLQLFVITHELRFTSQMNSENIIATISASSFDKNYDAS